MITDEQIQNAYLRLYEKGILKKEVRSYEVSVWTLQDDFVTVLKWSDVEQKGRIEHPKMTLSNDNMYEFSFSIPMYYDNGGGILEENPLWYHTQNGNIMINMRKVKVIFNKHTDNEKVFDFMITKITEEHAGDILTAEIKCEELAFHELGKIGYKYSLSLDEYDTDLVSYQTKGYWEMPHGRGHSKPKLNVLYWCSKIGLVLYPANNSYLNPGQWYYKILMSWQTFPFSVQRLSNIVYEESYACEWDADLKVTRIESMREKERTVEVSESNIYNITLEIAKLFNIFCRYEYIYDVNYHIIGRVVVFFNNFIHDYDAFSITYPYSSKRISRELDSTDLTTKLYVRTMDDSSTLLGYASICDSPANKIKEDYILNFDYLFETGSLDETYRTFLEEYDKNIYLYNSRLIPLEAEIAAYEDKITELEANITLYTNSIALDTEQINANSALAQELVAKYDNTNTEGTYIDAYNSSHPAIATIIPDANGNYYINLNALKKGILVGSLHIYRNYNTSTSTLSNEVSGYSVNYDDYGNPIAIYGISPTSSSARVYLTYEYEPHLYYDAIVKTWKEKLYNDTVALNKNKLELENLDSNGEPQEPYGVKTLLQLAQTSYNRNLAAKNDLIDLLLLIMGPALREGYWQPESYLDYGELYTKNSSIPNAYYEKFNWVHTSNNIMVGWDTKLFDEELDISYANGVNETTLPYPSINITNIYSDIKAMQEISSNVCVMFYNGLNREVSESLAFSNIKDIKTFAIGSGAVFTFIKGPDDTIYPALTITGAKGLSDIELDYMRNGGFISIGILTTNIVDSNVYINIGNRINITNDSYWTFGPMSPWTTRNGKYVLNHTFSENYQAVYPRIKFSSLMLKTSSDTLFVRYNNELLEEYEDYYIRNRPYKYYLEDVDLYGYTIETLVTIKPEVLARYALKTGTVQVDYTLSNASTAIYLDALEISKENAYPKVTYTVEPNMLDESIMSTLYDKLNYLVMINDVLLKFKNVFGYISKLDLDLDAPWNDTIEIKNYKNKFEDIFSLIVAQTEQLLRNGSVLDSVARGTYLLSPTSLKSTLTSNNLEMIDYLAENFLTSDVMQDFLSNIFLEVSSILGNSNSAIGETVALTAENSKILGDFAALILEELVSRTFRQTARPTDFKAGDIWIEVKWDNQTHEEVEVARYVATSDSNNSMPGYGWTRTHNGSLASLAGPGIDIDPNTGTIQLNADTATIVGNNAVEIGGVQINIGSTSENPNGYGGVNIVAAAYDSQNFEGVVASKVLINPTKITMFGSEIEMKAGAATDGAIGVTAMTLSGLKGIWLGSNNEIRLFSGTTTLDGKLDSGANIALTPTYLLLGVSSGSNGTAVKMDTSAITLAAGSSTITTIESKGISGVIGNGSSIPRSLTGMRLTKEFFGIAMTNSSSINAIIMNEYGITLGSGVGGVSSIGAEDLSSASGSYIRISGSEIKLNSLANLIVDTANVKINAKSSPYFRVEKDANNYMECNSNGLTVKGAINATSLTITEGANITGLTSIAGWTIAANKLSSGKDSGNTSTYVALDSGSANQNYAIWCGKETAGDAPFRVTRAGELYINALKVWNGSTYETVLFSQNFKSAISIGGAWNGSTLVVSATAFNSTGLQKTANMTASVNVASGTINYGSVLGLTYITSGKIYVTLSASNVSGQSSSISVDTDNYIDAGYPYRAGYSDAVGKIIWSDTANGTDVPNTRRSIELPTAPFVNARTYNLTPIYSAGYNTGWTESRNALTAWNGGATSTLYYYDTSELKYKAAASGVVWYHT